MPAQFIFPPDGSAARAVGLTAWSSGMILPLWPNIQAWESFGAALAALTVAPPVSGTLYGFAGAATDQASGAWMPQYNGALLNVTSGASGFYYSLPTTEIMTGVTYSPGVSSIYAVSASGHVYYPTGASGVGTVATSFGGTPCWGLAASGASLFTLFGASSGLGTLALSSIASGVSGVILTPMAQPSCLAAASGAVAVGGWSFATLASGVSGIAVDPLITTNLLATRPAANAIDLYISANEIWTVSQTISGGGAPTDVAWANNGLTAFVTDPTHNSVSVIAYSAGVISTAQTLAVSGAAAVAIGPLSNWALVCQPASGIVHPLNFTGSTWVTGATVAGLPGAQSVVATAASGAAVGFASGVALLGLSGSTWSVSASAALPFAPNALAIDTSGNLYAAGSSGASGYLSVLTGTTIAATLSWAGSGLGVVWRQAQIVVGDPANNLLRVFGQPSGIYAQAAQTAGPAGLVALAIGSVTLFAPASGATWEYQFTAPYTLERLRSGVVSVYASGAWASATLGVGQWPEVLTFDVSGNVTAATLQNTLYTVSRAGTVLASGTIAQLSPQPQTTPIGVSALDWFGGHLFGASSLAGALVEIE